MIHEKHPWDIKVRYWSFLIRLRYRRFTSASSYSAPLFKILTFVFLLHADLDYDLFVLVGLPQDPF